MKNLLVVSTLLLSLYNSCLAQWTPNENNIYNSNSGNVGIGISNPTQKLEINGNTSADGYYIKTAWNNSRITGNGEFVEYRSSWYHTFFGLTNTDPSLYINARDNKLGIATTSPSEALQIGSYNNNQNYKIALPGIYNFENIKIGQFGNGAAGLEIVNHTNLTNSYGIRIIANADQASGLQFQYAPPVNSYGSLQFTTGLYMGINGHIGIGTTNPDFKLTVNGKIKAEEIQVVVDVPADYVFDADYKLQSLEEVESYIKANRHLPGVPDAQSLITNGWQVGEMNNKLLEKVEEITLYLIQLKKENEEFKKRIELLERRNEKQ